MSHPLDHLRKYNVILGSGSPRRKELLDIIWPDYKVIVSNAEEIIPDDLDIALAPAYLAELKANDLISRMPDDYLLITADTVVIHDEQILGKPRDRADAADMLAKLSGGVHEVISGVCVKLAQSTKVFSDRTHVTIDEMSTDEIDYYIDNYQVMDKAGSYGIQDWLGVCKVSSLQGSYYNVMGLPVHLLYQYLLTLS